MLTITLIGWLGIGGFVLGVLNFATQWVGTWKKFTVTVKQIPDAAPPHRAIQVTAHNQRGATAVRGVVFEWDGSEIDVPRRYWSTEFPIPHNGTFWVDIPMIDRQILGLALPATVVAKLWVVGRSQPFESEATAF